MGSTSPLIDCIKFNKIFDLLYFLQYIVLYFNPQKCYHFYERLSNQGVKDTVQH